MKIKALRNFKQNGRCYVFGRTYKVEKEEITANKAYYEVLVSEKNKEENKKESENK